MTRIVLMRARLARLIPSAAPGLIATVAKTIGERGRFAAEADQSRGQAMPTLLDEWEQQRSGAGTSQRQGPLLDQFHSVTPGAIAMRRLRHLRQVVGWMRKL
jgi:hypothetical protein